MSRIGMRHPRRRRPAAGTLRRAAPLAVAALGLVASGTATRAQQLPLSDPARPPALGSALPFGPGEELLYRVRSGRFGEVGSGALRVAGIEEVRGRTVYLLTFDVRAKVALAGVTDSTRSWLDPVARASLRYRKDKRAPLGSGREHVELFGAERRWTSADGRRAGAMPTDRPLDELSFLYYLRTLPLQDSESHVLVRHFDLARNPVRVRVLGRERVRVPAGEFDAIVVEMRVRDAGVFGGDGVLRLHLTDDARRLPVRIETSMPLAGTVFLEMTGATLPSPDPVRTSPDAAVGIRR